MTRLSRSVLYSTTELTVSELREVDETAYFLDAKQTSYYQELSQRMESEKVLSYIRNESSYPFKFIKIYAAPYIVYAIWNVDLLNKNILGIVWPRKISHYGSDVLTELFERAKYYDIVTVSWLAEGVDTLGHRLSIKHGIPTIAILGGWLRHFLRGSKRSILREILDAWGLVLSEFKIDQPPANYTFPQRNRIIAWLSDMVFLPEAGKKSGSLITVDFAHKMKIPVYGVPNDIYTANSAGLLEAMQQDLVTPVIDIEKMLEKYFSKKSQDNKLFDLQQNENVEEADMSEVVILISKNPDWLSLEEIMFQSGLSTEEVMSQLSVAEVMGQVRNSGGVWRSS